MQTQTTTQRMRIAALTLSLFAVLIMTVFLLPSARAFAQGLLKQIGGYIFTQGVPEPLDASQLPAPINVLQTSSSTSIELTSDSVVANDLLSASSLAGFTVLLPSYLPPDYIPMDGGWRITTENNSTAVTNGYFDTGKNFFLITQWKVDGGDRKTFVRDEIVDVDVRGQPGIWLPSASSNSKSTALVWDANGITYSIISNGVALDEMLKVAESLGR